MLAQSGKTISGFFVLVDFHLYCAEPNSPHGAYWKVMVYLSESSSMVGAYSKERA